MIIAIGVILGHLYRNDRVNMHTARPAICPKIRKAEYSRAHFEIEVVNLHLRQSRSMCGRRLGRLSPPPPLVWPAIRRPLLMAYIG